MEASLYQRRVLEFVHSGTGNAVVRATAGAGKTTTLVQVAEILPRDLRTCFLAFGKDASAELKARLPKHVQAMTTHSLGRRALNDELRQRGVKLQPVEDYKYKKLVWDALKPIEQSFGLDREEVEECEEYLAELVRFARLNYTDTKDENEVRALAVRYNLTPPASLPLETELHACLRRILRKGAQEALTAGWIDFTDMLYVPQAKKLDVPTYDFVCVDEAQDYSAVALDFTMRLVHPEAGGRLLFVGDPRQSIFGFAGADSDALDRIITRAQAAVLPLSITYRCPSSHVELAKRIAPETEVSPTARDGNVHWIHDKALPKWVREGDLVLCRSNGPLVSTCLRLARDGKRAFVRGRDLAKKLADMSRKAFRNGLHAYDEVLAAFEDAEIAQLRARLRGRPHEETVIADRRDLIACLRYLVDDLAQDANPTQATLEERIQRTFGEDDSAVVLSTVHRAKGREADRVVILYPELMPATYAETPEAIRGEECVQFVALTRAKRDLVFVESPSRDDLNPIERALRGA